MTIQRVDKFYWVLLKIVRDSEPVSEQEAVAICRERYPRQWDLVEGSQLRTKPVGWPAGLVIGNFTHLLNRNLVVVEDTEGNNAEAAYRDRSLSAITHFADHFIFRTSDLYREVQDTFPISLSLYAEQFTKPYSVVAYPDFDLPGPLDVDVFVIMPYRDELQYVYTEAILPVIEELGLVGLRGDDFSGSQTIVDEVWSAIYNSKLCIVDCSGNNPNVFYELGIAHALGRPVILISQTIDSRPGIMKRLLGSDNNNIPFDIRHRRIIRYSVSEEGLDKLRDELEAGIRAVLTMESP